MKDAARQWQETDNRGECESSGADAAITPRDLAMFPRFPADPRTRVLRPYSERVHTFVRWNPS